MPLNPADLRHLTAAVGYLELGMPLDANEELENIDPEHRHATEVLMLRVDIYCKLKKWDLMEIVAGKLAEGDPSNVQWSLSYEYATRRAESIEAA